MSKEKKSLSPKWRFPEFQNIGEWEETTIGDIGRFYYGKSAPKWSLDENAPTPCVRYGELYTKFGAIITETYSRTNIDPVNLRFSKGGEILVPRVGEKPEDFGKCCCFLTLKNIAIGEMISVYETKQNPLFYTYYFRRLHRQFAKVVEGQNVKNLYYVELEPLKILRPELPEQQKIADFLTSLDELITAETDKLEVYKTHKKGLMQKLFPAEGKTMPEWRFPEFRNDDEWICKSIGKITHVTAGATPSTAEPEYWNGDIPWMNSGELNFKRIYNVENRITKLGLENSSTKLIPPGCVLIGLAGQGKTRGTAAINYIELCTNQSIAAIHPNEKEFISEFLFNRIDSLYSYLRSLSKGEGGRGGLNLQIIKAIEILFPSIPEQQKIADCLSSMDELITTQILKIEAHKTHKKGLLQGLFSSVDEVGE